MTEQKDTATKTYRSKNEIEEAFLTHQPQNQENQPQTSTARRETIDENTIKQLRILFRAN